VGAKEGWVFPIIISSGFGMEQYKFRHDDHWKDAPHFITILKHILKPYFSKLIPEFYSLAMADQEYLLRSTILELLILKVGFLT